jgi:outer membrane receptor protein involved in Fe transport
LTAPWLKDHALGLGWDGGLSIYREHETQDDATLPGTQSFDFDNSFDAHINRLALYVQDEWNVTPAWSLYLGARWEGVDTRTTGPGLDASSRLSVLSPLMQTLWKIPERQGDQVRLALTRTYKAPELRRLVPRHYYSFVNSPVEPDFTGNPGLKPELATGIDASFEHYWSDGALISVALSSRDIDGITSYEVRLDGGRWVSAPRNLGKARVRALELEAKFPLKAVMQQAPDIDLRTSISRNWSYVDGVPAPGNRLENQRPLSVNVGADFKRGRWSGGASFSYVKGGWSRSSVAEWDYSSAQRDLEVYVFYKFNPKTGLRFSARDLLRPSNVSISRYADLAGSLDDRSTKPGYIGWRLQLEHKL